MSDDARAFHKAWCNVMHGPDEEEFVEPPVAVKCIWHILQSWNRKLSQLIHEKDLQNSLLELLRAMFHTKNATNVQQVITLL